MTTSTSRQYKPLRFRDSRYVILLFLPIAYREKRLFGSAWTRTRCYIIISMYVCVYVCALVCVCVCVCIYYVRTENHHALISYSELLPFRTLSTACGRITKPVRAANFSISLFVLRTMFCRHAECTAEKTFTEFNRNPFLANLCGYAPVVRVCTHARSKQTRNGRHDDNVYRIRCRLTSLSDKQKQSNNSSK